MIRNVSGDIFVCFKQVDVVPYVLFSFAIPSAISLAGMLVPFAREDTMASMFGQRGAEPAYSGKKIYETER